MKVRFTGPTDSYHSIAMINQYICSMLHNSEHFTVVDGEEPEDIEIRHSYPPSWKPTKAKYLIYLLEWEFERVPLEWMIQVNKKAHSVIVPSEHLKSIYQNAGVDIPIYVIPHGVNKDLFHPVPRKRNTYRFLYIGSYQYRKGLDLLLDVWNAYFKNDPTFELIIKDMTHVYGERDIDTSASNITYIKEVYSTEQMAKLYQSCDCFISTSRGESFCLPLIEASSCGLQIIAPCTKPFTEVVKHANFVSVRKQVVDPYKKFIGKQGDSFTNMGSHFTVYEVNKDDLLKKMRECIKRPYKQEKIHTWYEVLLKYEEVIKNIVETIL